MVSSASILTLLAGIAAAQLHAPVGEPKGNPITRPLNEIVPACRPFTITWQPTTPNTVSVLLLKGPATNVVKFGPALAQGIPNSGSLAWTPAADLEATAGPNGYGIQVIDDVTGQYQYSTQFGISKEGCGIVVSSSHAAPVPAATSYAGGYPVASSVHVPAVSKSEEPSYPTAPAANVTTPVATKTPSGLVSIYSTGAPHANTSVIQPTKPLSVPASLRPSATGNVTTPTLPESTGAASALQAGLSFAGAAVAMALML